MWGAGGTILRRFGTHACYYLDHASPESSKILLAEMGPWKRGQKRGFHLDWNLFRLFSDWSLVRVGHWCPIVRRQKWINAVVRLLQSARAGADGSLPLFAVAPLQTPWEKIKVASRGKQ